MITAISDIRSNLRPGINYQLAVPMDSMMGTGIYLDNALIPLVSFRIQVIIGTTTNLPIEMSRLVQLGKPAESTRIDLTLGVDSDGDGLPDAWEQLLLDRLGGGTLREITPAGDSDGDGISNRSEYMAGTYAFDPEDGLFLALKEIKDQCDVLELFVIEGRTYEIQRSFDLKTWERVDFRVPAESRVMQSRYTASGLDVQRIQIEVPTAVSETAACFYKVFVW